MLTRFDYLQSYQDNAKGAALHRQYYAQFVNDRTIYVVVNRIGAKRLLASTDPHFNDIPLMEWDSLVTGLPLAMHMETAGDYYTMGNGVCIAKEAARQYVERHALPRYVVDGAVSPDDPDGPLYQGDGQYPPFVVFDTKEQRNLPGQYSTREAAEAALAVMQSKA